MSFVVYVFLSALSGSQFKPLALPEVHMTLRCLCGGESSLGRREQEDEN